MVTRLRGRAGFTLTEALVTVAITGILAGMGGSLLLQINRYFIMSKTRLELQREARAVMYLVTRNIRQASAATITVGRYSSNEPFFSSITFTKAQGTTMTYRSNGANLEQVVGNKTSVLSKNLKYLAFTFPRSDDMGIISVSMTLQQNIYQGRVKALHMASEKVQVMNE